MTEPVSWGWFHFLLPMLLFLFPLQQWRLTSGRECCLMTPVQYTEPYQQCPALSDSWPFPLYSSPGENKSTKTIKSSKRRGRRGKETLTWCRAATKIFLKEIQRRGNKEKPSQRRWPSTRRLDSPSPLYFSSWWLQRHQKVDNKSESHTGESK